MKIMKNINDNFRLEANVECTLEYRPARPSYRFHNHLKVSVVFQFQRVDCKQVSNFRAVAGHLGQTGTRMDLEEIEICTKSRRWLEYLSWNLSTFLF